MSYREKASLSQQRLKRAPIIKANSKLILTLSTVLLVLVSFPNWAGTDEGYFGPSLSQKGSKRQVTKLQDVNQPATRAMLRQPDSKHGRLYPEPQLENVSIGLTNNEEVSLFKMPKFTTQLSGRFAGKAGNDKIVLFSPDPELQTQIEGIAKRTSAPHTAIVAMEPKTGRVLAIASKSSKINNLSLHAGFPAASLFKVITAAAAIEWSDIQENSKVYFRGGNYTLNKYNYLPSSKLDKRFMTLGEAMGKSCNPVFARVALNHLNGPLLETYAENFGFNSRIPFDVNLPVSSATIPDSKYGLSRTAAGFGQVYISPVHAAAMMSAITNKGLMPRPRFVDSVVSETGRILYDSDSEYIKRITRPETAEELVDLMHYTTTEGTSRKEFALNKKSSIPGIDVIGKTGTLRGKNPWGLNTWFIGAAPKQNPTIAIAVITVNPNTRDARASGVARQVLEKYFQTNRT